MENLLYLWYSAMMFHPDFEYRVAYVYAVIVGFNIFLGD